MATASPPKFDYDFADAWRPAEGDVLEGTIKALDVSPAGEYGAYPIVTIVDDAGIVKAFHAYHSAAMNTLKSLKPNIGDTVGIKYLGKRESKSSNRTYDAYRIIVDREQGFDWEGLTTVRDEDSTDDPDKPPF